MNNYAEIAFNDFNNNVRSIFYDIHKNKLIWKDTNELVDLSTIGRSYTRPTEPWEHHNQTDVNPLNPGVKSGPFRLIKIQLGLSCNFSCDYCAQTPHNSPKELSLRKMAKREDVYKLLENLDHIINDTDKVIFELWGGEPFLYWPIINVLATELINKYSNSIISITTNGSLINSEIANWILDNDNITITISHDGESTHRDENVLKNINIYNLFHELKGTIRPLKFNCVLTIDNISISKIRKFIADELETDPIEIILLTEGLAMPIIHNDNDYDAKHLNVIYKEIISGESLFAYGVDIFGFFKMISESKPSNCIEQKCGLDRADVLVLNLKTQHVVTCQNTLPEGKHDIGPISDLKNLKINTIFHWKSRKNCSNCPLLSFCKGSCLYLEGEKFDQVCKSQFFYRLPFLCAALYWITGLIPISLKCEMGEFDLKDITFLEK